MYADAERRITHTARRLLLKARQASYSLTVLPRAQCPDPLSNSSAAVEKRALPFLLGMIELRCTFKMSKKVFAILRVNIWDKWRGIRRLICLKSLTLYTVMAPLNFCLDPFLVIVITK